SPIAHAVGNERFLSCRRSFVLVQIETNQQIRTEADALPTDKHQKKVVSEHQREHREHEKIQVGEEAIVTAVTFHVAGGENVNQKTDKGNEEHIDAAQTVHGQPEIRAKTSHLYPRPEMIHYRLRGVQRTASFEGEIKSQQR